MTITIQKHGWRETVWDENPIGTPKGVPIVRDIITDVLLQKGKTSVDSGSFQPGDYRVNPYDVWFEEVEVDSQVVQSNATDWVPSNYRLVKQAGDFSAAMLNNIGGTDFPSMTTSLRQQALEKAHAKLAQSDLTLGEDLGEIRETIKMLKNPFNSFFEFFQSGGGSNLKKIRKLLKYGKTRKYLGKKGKEAAKAASDTWLELRYGLMPLMYLAGDLMEMADQKLYETFDPEKIRSVRAMVSTTHTDPLWSGSVKPLYYTWYYDVATEYDLKAYAAVQYRQSIPLSTWDKLGLTPRYWPETAWQLTRLSFVWDWFTTIGPWLQKFRLKPELEVLGNTVGVKMVKTQVVNRTGVHVDPRTILQLPGRAKKICHRYQRVVGTELPLLPHVRLDVALDLNKWVDSLSLLIQSAIK
jgi:hypothetical protein